MNGSNDENNKKKYGRQKYGIKSLSFCGKWKRTDCLIIQEDAGPNFDQIKKFLR